MATQNTPALPTEEGVQAVRTIVNELFQKSVGCTPEELGEWRAQQTAEKAARHQAEVAQLQATGDHDPAFMSKVRGIAKVDDHEGLGFEAARVLQHAASAKFDGKLAASEASKMGEKQIAEVLERAVNTEDDPSGGFVVPEEVSNKIWPLVRRSTYMDKLNVQIEQTKAMQFTQTSMVSASAVEWIGEQDQIKASGVAFAKKGFRLRHARGLLPVSNTWLKSSNTGALPMIRNSMVETLRLAKDFAFFMGLGTNNQPEGLNVSVRGDQLHSSALAAGNIQSGVEQLYLTLFGAIEDAHIDMKDLRWVLPHAVKRSLMMYRENGLYIYQDELKRGLFLGIPFVSVPPDLIPRGAGDSEKIYLGAWNKTKVVHDPKIDIAKSTETAYEQDVPDGSGGTTTVTRFAFPADETVFRIKTRMDCGVVHAPAVQAMDGVVWHQAA